MKKNILLYVVVAALACACSSELPKEVNIQKEDVEYGGNAFLHFSLGEEVKLLTSQNSENPSQWTIQAVVPIHKVTDTPLEQLTIDIIPSDEEGARLRDGFALQCEDLPGLLPAINASKEVDLSIKFSVMDQKAKYMTSDELAQLLDHTKKLRMVFIAKTNEEPTAAPAKDVATPAAPAKTEAAMPAAKNPATKKPETPPAPREPMTLQGLFSRYNVHGMLSQYEQALKRGDKKGAKQIEDRLWEIEKRVKANQSIPEQLRSSFVSYIEKTEDEIEDRY